MKKFPQFPKIVGTGNHLDQQATLGKDPVKLPVIGWGEDVENAVEAAVGERAFRQVGHEPGKSAMPLGGKRDAFFGNVQPDSCHLLVA
ncbi:hypothetical protein D1872_309310 [compost metagenome]